MYHCSGDKNFHCPDAMQFIRMQIIVSQIAILQERHYQDGSIDLIQRAEQSTCIYITAEELRILSPIPT